METQKSIAEMTAAIVSSYVSNNAVSYAELPTLIKSVYEALSFNQGRNSEENSELPAPAVSIKKSVTPEYLICLEDGKRFRSLKRHLLTHHNLTPDQYRTRWGLPADYAMVAPSYAATRSRLAKQMGLGQRADAPKRRKSGTRGV